MTAMTHRIAGSENDIDERRMLKTCIKCHRSYPRTREFFYGKGGAADGLRPDCKKCCADAYNEALVKEDYRG